MNEFRLSSYKARKNIYLLAFVLLLLVSWIIPGTHYYWDLADAAFYKFVHGFFLKTQGEQVFWAVMNSRNGDNLSHALTVSILLYYIFWDQKGQKLKRAKQVLFIVFAVVASIIISKGVQGFIAERVSIKRDSPSLVLGHQVVLSEVVDGLENVKDTSRRSFPGDHAMTLILLSLFIFTYCKQWYLRVLTVVNALFFMMPRMISGGHWLTDALMGSIPIAFFAFAFWMWVGRIGSRYLDKKKQLSN